jgi:hypothetical protein
VEQNSDGSAAAAGYLGDLVDREILDIAQGDHLSLSRRKLRDGLPDEAPLLADDDLRGR